MPGTITGRVLDYFSRSPITGANVILIGTNKGAATDLEGKFIIVGLAPSTYHIQASALGYSSETKSEVAVLPAKSSDITLLLEPTVLEGQHVTVGSGLFIKSPDLPVSTRSFSTEEIRRAPSSYEDPQRAIQVLPGVFSRNDQTNEIIVRGGSPNENLTIVDGLEIDNINHFPDQSTSGGPISAVNAELIQEITFSTGGFSARYGDRLSSILDIELADGNADNNGGQLEMSMAGAGLNSEGKIPYTDNTYTFSFRKSYLDLLQGPIGLTAVPKYWDTQFKVSGEIDSKTQYSFIGFYGKDRISIESDKPDAWSRGAESVDATGYNLALGARLRKLTGIGFFETVIGRSVININHDVTEIQKREGTNENINRHVYYYRGTEAINQLHVNWNQSLNRKNNVSAGLSVKPIEFSHNIWAETDSVTYDLNDNGVADTIIVSDELRVNLKETTLKYAGFVQYRWRPIQRISFVAGLRMDGLEYSSESKIGPRLSLRWDLNRRLNATLAYGVYHQSLALSVYTADPANKNLPHPHAEHYVIGLNYLLTESTRFSFEGYIKKYNDLSISEGWLVRREDPLFRSFRSLPVASKDSWGLELFAQQKLVSDWFGTFAYSYGESDTFIPGDKFASDFDFRHVVTVSTGKNFSGDPVKRFQKYWYGYWTYLLPLNGDELTLSTKYRYVSGRPFTERIWTDDGPEFDYHWEESSEINRVSYPDYSRWDIRWDSKWYFGGKAMVSYFEIQNILDCGNVAEYIYADDGELDVAYQFRFFFVGGFRFEW